MKTFFYSKKKVLYTGKILFTTTFLIVTFIYILKGYLFIFLFPILLSFYFIYFARRVLSVTVFDDYLIVYKRKFIFYKYETKINVENGIYQHWDFAQDRTGKGYFYSIEKNSNVIFMIRPIDQWEKATIEEIIKQVLKIGMPLKGNLKDTLSNQDKSDQYHQE